MEKYKVTLSFSSVLKISTLLGIGYGLFCIPIYFIYTKIIFKESLNYALADYMQLFLGGLAQGIIMGAVVGVLGYPIYILLAKKFGGIVLKGEFNSESK